MTRDPAVRLDDILAAVAAIDDYLDTSTLDEPVVFDAVRMRLIEIGEAVKAIPADLLGTEPCIAWQDVARMRDWMAHRYFDTAATIVEQTAREDMGPLAAAVRRMRERL